MNEEIIVKIGADISGLANDLKKAQADIAGLGDSVEGIEESGNRASLGIGKILKAVGLVALTAKAIGLVKESLDGAISRYDTLNSFPRVLQHMGFDAEDSGKAINDLSDGIQGLPTPLDAVAKTAQNIAIMTGDLEGAVETTLALNNAFLASGSSSADAERGLTQYMQMLSKGEVDMQSWRTLQETMGVALNKTAKEFGFTGESAQNDLYAALKDGDITFDQFNSKIVELSDGVGGFADMALDGSRGIATSWQNIKTAITTGVANIIGAVEEAMGGVGSIADSLDVVKTGIQSMFKGIAAAIPVVVKAVTAFKGKLDEWKPVIDRIKESMAPFLETLRGAFTQLLDSVGPIWESLKVLFESLTPILLLIGQVVGGVLVTAFGIAISVFTATIAAIGPLINAVINLVDIVVNMVNVIVAVLTGDFAGAWEYLGDIATSVKDLFINIFDTLVAFIGTFVQTIIDFFYGLYMTLVGNSIVPDLVNEIVEWFTNLVTWVVDLVKAIVTGVTNGWNALMSATSAIFNAVKAVLTGIWNGIKAMFSAVVSSIVNFVRTQWNNIKTTTSNVFNAVKSFISTVWNGIKTFFTKTLTAIWTTVKQKFNDIKTAISDKMTEAKDKISEIWDGVMSFFRDIDLKSIGSDIIQGLINGITSKVKAVGDAVKDVTSAITGKIKGILNIKSPSRVLMKLGGYAGEGLAIGIANEESNVAKAAQGLADASIVEPTMSYATPNANYGSLSAALSGEVNVNQRDSMLIGAIASLEDKLTNLRFEMDGQKVGNLVTPHVNGTNAVDDVTRYF